MSAEAPSTLRRIIVECGTGNDLYGEDYTKASCRAVQDALHHSSLQLFRTLGLPRERMQVEIVVGVQRPAAVDVERVAAQVPYGTVRVRCELGGLDVPDADTGAPTVIATVAVIASVPLPEGRFTLDEE